MIPRLWGILWSLPLLALFVCCYSNYRFNQRRECRQIERVRDARQQQECREGNPGSLRQSAALRQCFLENLAAAAGRGNLFFIGGCLYLGGAGSLLWMALATPFCIFLRFVQLSLLWPAANPEAGKSSKARENVAEPASRLRNLIDEDICQRMHFPSARWLSRLLGAGSAAFALSVLPLYGVSAGLGGWFGIPFPAAALAVILTAALLAVISGEFTGQNGTSFGRFRSREHHRQRLEYRRERWVSLATVAYLLLLGIALLGCLRWIFLLLGAVVSDGVQVGSYIGAMSNRGQMASVVTGVGLACYVGGLTEESGSLLYIRTAQGCQYADDPIRVGYLAMGETAVELFGIGLGSGLLLLTIELWQMGNPATDLHSLLGCIREGGGLVGIVLFCLWLPLSLFLTGFAWKRQMTEVGLWRESGVAVCCAVAFLWNGLLQWPAGAFEVTLQIQWSQLLFLFLWLPLVCQLIGWICLSERFRGLWESYIGPL